jgi:drug/metabolite transporter (DMT)-like permease
LGFVLGIGSAIFFAAASICFKLGQRGHPSDNGLFLSLLVNFVLLGTASLFLDWPTWSTGGFLGFIAGGLLGSVGGRASNLRAIRSVGPSRANAFLAGNPFVAAIVGWFLLDETLGLREFAGGSLVVSGLVWLVRARSDDRSAPDHPSARGYAWAATAPLFFGFAFAVRKWSLILFPSTVIGAFIGSTAALIAVTVTQSRTDSLGSLLDRNLRPPPPWYLAAGVATSVALLSQFTAFSYLPAWVVGILQGTQGIWTLVFGWLFLREDERIDARLVGAIVLVAAGVILIGLEV